MIITNKQFPNYRKYEMVFEGRPLSMEVGKLAELCNAAVLAATPQFWFATVKPPFSLPVPLQPARKTGSIISLSLLTLMKSCMLSDAFPEASCAVKASPACRLSLHPD